MAIPRGLRDAILKYRKRRKRPIGATIPGYAGQCDFVKPVTRVPGDNYVVPAGSVPVPEVYMDDLPEDYIPEAGFMEISELDYGPYDGHIAESMFHLGNRFPPTPADRGDFEPSGKIRYEDCLMTPESFEQQMRLLNSQFEAPGTNVYGGESAVDVPNIGDLPSLEDLTGALFQLRQVFPEDHPDVLRLSTLVQELSYNAPMSQPEDFNAGIDSYGSGVTPDPFEFDPFQEAEQIFDQQMQLLDRSFELPGFETMEHQALMHPGQSMLEQTMGGIGPAMDVGPESLDDIVEACDMPHGMPMVNGMPAGPAYDDCLMTPDLFGQAMNGALGPMEDPYMDTPDCDDMPPEDMYDPMPDPMKNPYMMPGPMGPNFMPDPPPGP